MELTHLGHSCVLIEAADQRILIDPGTFSDFADVRELTAVLVTHQHPDHLDPARFGDLLAANPAAQAWLEPETAAQQQDAFGDRVNGMSSGGTVQVGTVSVTPVGDLHAVIHDYVPRIHNLGLVVRADGEPTVFHPGDALDADPGEVDVVLVPLMAPWSRVSDTVEFVRRVGASRAVPIHDGLLNDTGREMLLGHVRNFGAEGGLDVLDLRGAGATGL
ncbi:MBL fold metallo-hydrolase [Ornithinicoccus hortensis]|uniref:L-ascorbate metabolism protein UlaG (Beta-lactamase superfamily) n=1 Tax=Ornithinicoccus hortensis TaxID=82346 RepID=A0A542YSP1_9MICO|nr:MBL fold metallo-hydrolase [Ornithinicoccus hortensis]TQL50964.1 L-ascorbate metabolism protein UlaG (beta-lactamase superfamily) [Ornithinicoccus hortensis]